MILKTEKGEFHAHFWHHQRGKLRRKNPRFITELRFHEGPCKLEQVGVDERTGKPRMQCMSDSHHAEAKCHTKKDVFRREAGRATALDRLLKMTTIAGREVFDRATRIQIWDAYKAAGAKLPASRGAQG